MSKKLPYTPNTRIRAALRNLFLRSREHAACLKRDLRTCRECGKKASVAKGKEQKVVVHHLKGIDWDGIFDFVREQLLCEPELLVTLCPACHEGRHKGATK